MSAPFPFGGVVNELEVRTSEFTEFDELLFVAQPDITNNTNNIAIKTLLNNIRTRLLFTLSFLVLIT